MKAIRDVISIYPKERQSPPGQYQRLRRVQNNQVSQPKTFRQCRCLLLSKMTLHLYADVTERRERFSRENMQDF